MKDIPYARKNFQDQKYFRDCFSKFLISKIYESFQKENPQDFMCRDNFILFYDLLRFYNVKFYLKDDKPHTEFLEDPFQIDAPYAENKPNHYNFRDYLKFKALSLELNFDDLINEFKICYNFTSSKNADVSAYDDKLEYEILKFKKESPNLSYINSMEIYSSPIFKSNIPIAKRKELDIKKSNLKQTLEINNITIYAYESNGILGFFKLNNNKLEPYYPTIVLETFSNDMKKVLSEIVTLQK